MSATDRRRWARAAVARTIALAGLGLAAGCGTTSTLLRPTCSDAQLQLTQKWESLRYVMRETEGCGVFVFGREDPCDRLRRDIEGIAGACPANVPALFASAILAYEDGKRIMAQQYLDRVLQANGSLPEAAMLRARIAMEDGNIAAAKRLIADEILVRPDHAGLREVYAAALYLDRNLVAARTSLDRAQALGAPGWRIAYHLGLLDEGEGNLENAAQHYRKAVEQRPDWKPAQSRLTALGARLVPAGSR